MTLDQISALTASAHLDVMGALHDGADTIVLLGPREPGFWAHVSTQPELHDGVDDPLDRWSHRAMGALARTLKATAIFPSDGPPYPPFISWALGSGRCFLAPSGLLVHDAAGLMISFRGALRIAGHLTLPAAPANPCDSCADQPCAAACPVSALTPDSYDVPACQSHIRGSDTAQCRSLGCAARRACPVSQSSGRLPAQSAFHMRAFLGE